MNLPNENFTVKVGPHTFDVIYDQNMSEATSTLGRCHHDELKIYLKPGGPKTQIEETFLHELIHAMINTAGLDTRFRYDQADSKPNDEEVCNELAPLLLQFIQDNKDLF